MHDPAARGLTHGGVSAKGMQGGLQHTMQPCTSWRSMGSPIAPDTRVIEALGAVETATKLESSASDTAGYSLASQAATDANQDSL